MFENTSRNELSALGEFGLIDHITKHFEINHASTIKGVGDDAAILDYADEQTVISTDLLLEGIHFDLSYVPLKHLGYKSIIVNLSDIYAMNAIPTQVLVSIGISNRFSLEAVEELYQGMLIACKRYNIDLVGGDTSSSKQGLVISVTALGKSKKEKIVKRDSAEVNDLVCVSGDLGAAYMGLQILEREKNVFLGNQNLQPDLEGYDYIVERQLKPEARKDIIELLATLNIVPSAMMDVSDGLASEVLHICKSSKVGCSIYEEKIPIDPLTYNTAREFNIDPTVCALSGGEDYELLFTIKQADYEKIKNNSDVSVIGHITQASEGAMLISKGGNQHKLVAQGWNAFGNNAS
ncbi:MAG: thiamine-phosphate kinase [bacterium]|jgi:thiamine-monophosphate kinase